VIEFVSTGNGPFSAEPRSPRAYFLDVQKVRLVVNPCAALLIEKIAHFQIGNDFLSVLLSGWKRGRRRLSKDPGS
jgi:hypothetical protein